MVTVIFCCFLSIWQLKRLEEKEVLIYKVSKKLNCLSYNSNNFFHGVYDIFSYWNSRPMFLIGYFDNNTVISLQARTSDGNYGVDVISPFHLFSGHMVLVNHGWFPSEYKLLEYNIIGKSNCSLLLTLRIADRQGVFIPNSRVSSHEWYSMDYFSLVNRYFGSFYSVPFFVSFNQYKNITSYDVLRVHGISNNHFIYFLVYFNF